MRARIKRRQRIRTITILATVIVIAVSLVVGFYIALNVRASSWDALIGRPVSSSDMSKLYQISHGAYGPDGSSLLVSPGNLQSATGQAYVSHGKPVVVYIGGDFCPYCAVERWSLILSLSRFGNFTNLHYMASALNEEDLATFTFTGSTYSSKYVVFTPIEQEDRDRNAIATIPANYTSGFNNAYPFMNFGNKYLLMTLIPDTSIISGKNFTQIFSDLATGTSDGTTLKQGANAITALICRITAGQPSSVCNAYAITTTTIPLAYSSGTSQGIPQPQNWMVTSPPAGKERS